VSTLITTLHNAKSKAHGPPDGSNMKCWRSNPQAGQKKLHLKLQALLVVMEATCEELSKQSTVLSVSPAGGVQHQGMKDLWKPKGPYRRPLACRVARMHAIAMAKMHRMLCPLAPTISSTTTAMCGQGGPPAATRTVLLPSGICLALLGSYTARWQHLL
jgi:hypothetical protein